MVDLGEYDNACTRARAPPDSVGATIGKTLRENPLSLVNQLGGSEFWYIPSLRSERALRRKWVWVIYPEITGKRAFTPVICHIRRSGRCSGSMSWY
jgi:hypothetical protein